MGTKLDWGYIMHSCVCMCILCAHTCVHKIVCMCAHTCVHIHVCIMLCACCDTSTLISIENDVEVPMNVQLVNSTRTTLLIKFSVSSTIQLAKLR